MPALFFQVTEAASNIIDPLISEINEAVLSRLAIRQYFSNSIYLQTARSTASQSGDGSGNINLARNRCDVTVETILNPANVTWDMATTKNQPAYGVSPLSRGQYEKIFCDPVAGVHILEHTMPAALFFTYKLRFMSYDAAQVAFDALLSQNHGTVVTMSHDIVYGYPITLRMLIALSTVHQNRQTFVGDFNTYLSTYSSVYWHRDIRRLDIGSTPQETQLTVQRQQLRCQALLECTQSEPEPERDGGIARSFTIEFTYKMQFGRPNMLQLVLPCAVENNPLPEALFSKQCLNANDFLQNILQEKSFATFMCEHVNYRPPPIMTQLPCYDDFIPPSDGMLAAAKYHSFVSAAFTLDIPGPTVIPFATLGPYTLHPTLLEIIKLHTSDELLGYQSLFNFTVFADLYPLDASLITIDTVNLAVTINATILAKNYRLVISEATDLRWVLPKWYPMVLKYRFFFPMTLERNLNIFLGDTAVQITADPDLVALIAQLMNRGKLDALIQGLISADEATYQLYSYTQTPQQFGDYIALTKALKTPDTTLYDLFVAACVTAQYITQNAIPGRSLRTPKGYPYGPGQGGFYAFNLPLRVFNTVLQPKHANQ